MSTLFGANDAGRGDTPLRDRGQLCEIFRSGEKPSSRFGIGIEYERLPVSRQTGLAVPYAAPSGRPSVESFLETLASTRGWSAERENGRIIALERAGTRVTLEPGAQVELSGRVQKSLDDARLELTQFVREADEVAAGQGIALLGLGYHPFSDFTEIGWVPKSRYKIMGPYLATRGHLAHGMMKATAGCQINLDYSSEADAMEKLRMAMGVSSVVTALCANSPLARGQANGFASKRSHIWLHTDPDRCGLLPFAFRDGLRYDDYVDYALDVPMMFVVRESRWLDMTGRTFRGYLDGDNAGLSPTMADWELHITTLFPEVRLKAYLEVRGSDSAGPGLVLAQAALWKGLFYDQQAARGAWSLVERATMEERLAFHRDATRNGLRARLRGIEATDLAQELIVLAERGLGPSESVHLQPLRQAAFTERAAPADALMARWSSEWRRDPRRLVEALAQGV
ncbi:MAG TPA: glutamate-cysteine ligase family protein [Patescibacteria group bacterium]|nr:glutamate-cysteine ligase family protein [Patescibacteria group bacterium]